MGVPNYQVPSQTASLYHSRREFEQGRDLYISRFRDPHAVHSALREIGNVTRIIDLFSHVSKRELEITTLQEHPEWATRIDEMVRLSYARYANGAYRPELSQLSEQRAGDYECTHIAASSVGPWAACRSRLFIRGEETSEITELFEFEEPTYFLKLRAFQELGRLTTHPLFDVWKRVPFVAKQARELQANALRRVFEAVLLTGKRFNSPTLAIFSDHVYRYVTEQRIIRAIPLRCTPRDSVHRRFLEQNFSRYWRDDDPRVFLLTNFE